MASTPKKSPTIFYWLSLVTAAATIVMLFFNWYSLQVASFGNDNLPTQYYGLNEVDEFIKDLVATDNAKISHPYVELEGGEWGITLGNVIMIGIAVTQGLHILLSLILMKRTPPCGILGGGGAIVFGLTFLVAFKTSANYLYAHQIDELLQMEILSYPFPFVVVMLGVATLFFGLLHRQESRALCKVKNPRAFVFPPENPEPV